MKIPLQVNTAVKILTENGHTAYIVGGAVRDCLMGRTADDWDITTSALPEDTLNAFSGFRTIETGIKHGTVTVVIDGMNIEITTYRIEAGYSDNRHPDSVSFTDKIEEDLARRDFTVNAIAYSPRAGFCDPFGGQSDIDKKIIRCVGEPDKRFGEDALRILRALRFSSVLDFEIEEKTAESIRKNYPTLKNISAERIFAELTKLLCGRGAGRILRDYPEVISGILPELAPMNGCGQNHPAHIYDVWGHTAAVVDAVAPSPELRYAALFHDSGKPACKSTDENGIDHFCNHARVSREIAEEALLRLKSPVKFRQKVCDLTEYHGFVPDKMSKKTYRKYIGTLGADTVRELFEIREADVRDLAPECLEDALEANRAGLEILNEIMNEKACFGVKDLAVNGNDIIGTGVEPSPAVGEILGILLNEVMEEKIENKKDTLIRRAEELKGKVGRSSYGNS